MNWAALTMPNGISRTHSAWVQEPDVHRPQWNASTTCPSSARTSCPWASVGRKQRLRSSPATWHTCAVASMDSGGVPLTPWTRSSTHSGSTVSDMTAPPPRRRESATGRERLVAPDCGHDARGPDRGPDSSARHLEALRMTAPVEFAVWAPLPERVRVQVDGAVHEMRKDDRGWWRAEVAAGPEADYGFLLDETDTPRPDPRSRRQPDGVHGLSRRYDPDSYAWGDSSWTGRPLAGGVVYEMHVGTFTPEGTFDAAVAKLDHLVRPRRRLRRAPAGQRVQRHPQLGVRRRPLVRRPGDLRRSRRLPAVRRRLPPARASA